MKQRNSPEDRRQKAPLSAGEEALALNLLSVITEGWLILRCDKVLTILRSGNLEALLGDALPEGLAELLPEEQLARFREACETEEEVTLDTELDLRTPAGKTLYLRLRGLCSGSGEERRFCLAVFDNTDQRRHQRDIHTQLEQYRLVTDRICGTVYLYDLESDVLYAYGDDAGLWGEERVTQQFLGAPAEEFSPRYLAYRETLREILLADEDFEKKLVAFPVSNTENRRKSVTAITLRDDAGRKKSRLCFLDDQEEALRERETLSLSARRDQLTGLFNRLACEERIGTGLKHMEPERSYVMLFLDLDGFKAVNDQMGHAVGDQVLRAAAKTIQACFRERDEVFRLGGDEFVVWMEGSVSRELLERKTVRLNQELGDISAKLRVPSVSVSVGAARACPGDTFETLYEAVDSAMYAAKHSGKGRCAFYHRNDQQTVLPGFPEAEE